MVVSSEYFISLLLFLECSLNTIDREPTSIFYPNKGSVSEPKRLGHIMLLPFRSSSPIIIPGD